MDPCHPSHLIPREEEFSMETGTACEARGLPTHLEMAPCLDPPVLNCDNWMAPLKSLDVT